MIVPFLLAAGALGIAIVLVSQDSNAAARPPALPPPPPTPPEEGKPAAEDVSQSTQRQQPAAPPAASAPARPAAPAQPAATPQAPQSQARTTAPPSQPAVPPSVFQRIAQNAINAVRAEAPNCAGDAASRPLAYDDRLRIAAQRHASDLAATRRRSHAGSDGSTVERRVAQAGFVSPFSTELVGWGWTTPEAFIRAVSESISDCTAMANPRFTHFGVASAQDTATPRETYWVLVLAAA